MSKDRYYELKHASHDELLEATLLKILQPCGEDRAEMLSIQGIMNGEIMRYKKAILAIVNKEPNAWEHVSEATLDSYREWKR